MDILIYIIAGIITLIIISRFITWYQDKYAPNYKSIRISGKVVDSSVKSPIKNAEVIVEYAINRGADKQTPVKERLYTNADGDFSSNIEKIDKYGDGIAMHIMAEGYATYNYTITTRTLKRNPHPDKQRILLQKTAGDI